MAPVADRDDEIAGVPEIATSTSPARPRYACSTALGACLSLAPRITSLACWPWIPCCSRPDPGGVARDPQLLRPGREHMVEARLRGLARPQHDEHHVVTVARDAELVQHPLADRLDGKPGDLSGGVREPREPLLQELAAPLDEPVGVEQEKRAWL